jgi:hypothetical protein
MGRKTAPAAFYEIAFTFLTQTFPGHAVVLEVLDIWQWRAGNGNPEVRSFEGEPAIGDLNLLFDALNQSIELANDAAIVKHIDCEAAASHAAEENMESGSLFAGAITLAHASHVPTRNLYAAIAVATTESSSHYISEVDIRGVLLRIAHVLDDQRLAAHLHSIQDLASGLAAAPSATKALRCVVDAVKEMFNPSEVAILLQQGNFLKIVQQVGVERSRVPPLFIPARKEDTGVCALAADPRNEVSYDPDTSVGDEPYLPVVICTRSQCAIKMRHQNAVVGVLLVGFPVSDGLLQKEEENVLRAICQQGASTVFSLRRSEEERTAMHFIKDNIPTISARFRKAPVADDDVAHAELLDAADCLDSIIRFVSDFTTTQREAQKLPEAICRTPLHSVLRSLLDSPLTNALQSDNPKVRLIVNEIEPNLIVALPEKTMLIPLLHLLKNSFEAIEQSGKPGSVSVDVAPYREFTPVLEGDLDYVSIEIKDDGPGIPEESQDRVFELFFSTKKDGTGLGLWSTKHLVESAGGSVSLESAHECGTVICILLPAVHSEGATNNDD